MKRRMKVLASVFVFCCLFVGCGKIFRYILSDDVASYTRVTFHEMYEQDNIDVLFVGSSHCYRSFVPEILDKELGLNTFNGGTSSQALDGSLMVIKEAARYHNISHIYLEMFFNDMDAIYKQRTQLTHTYIISDYIRPSIDKFIYLIRASGDAYYPNSFIVARRSWRKLLDLDYINDIIVKKQSDAYRNYDYSNLSSDVQWYAGKGYVADVNAVNNWNYFMESASVEFGTTSEDWLDSLSGIMNFCDNSDIDLTLVIAPMSNFLLADIGTYDEYINFIHGIIEGTDVDFYDFNLCKEEYFPNTSSLFIDDDHLNHCGAETFSYCFAKLIKGEISPQEMFYGSYSEKLKNLEPTVFGISYHDDTADDGTVLRNCKIVSNGAEGMEYEISMIPNEGEEYVLREYSDENHFVISPTEKGACIVRHRIHNDIETENEVQIELP